MYQEFSILEVSTYLKDKKIVISTNQDIFNEDYNDLKILLFERETRTPLLFDFDIDKKDLIITLKDWPKPNSTYILGISNLKNVLGQELDLGNFKTKIIFKSSITSKVEIISPNNFEKIDELILKVKEINEDEKAIKNNFFIEIAKDNAFIDSPYSFYVKNKNTIPLSLFKFGQYFMRVRVQIEENNNIEYGDWSDLVTFVYGKEKEEGNIEPDLDNNDDYEDTSPIVEEDFDIISIPEQGEITDSFLFEFNMPLDEFYSGSDIVIIRKDVK